MTKFVLVIWVCSFLAGNQCMPPVEIPKLYSSWYECSVAAYKESVTLLQKTGYANVNKYKVGTKFTCRATETL